MGASGASLRRQRVLKKVLDSPTLVILVRLPAVKTRRVVRERAVNIVDVVDVVGLGRSLQNYNVGFKPSVGLVTAGRPVAQMSLSPSPGTQAESPKSLEELRRLRVCFRPSRPAVWYCFAADWQ